MVTLNRKRVTLNPFVCALPLLLAALLLCTLLLPSSVLRTCFSPSRVVFSPVLQFFSCSNLLLVFSSVLQFFEPASRLLEPSNFSLTKFCVGRQRSSKRFPFSGFDLKYGSERVSSKLELAKRQNPLAICGLDLDLHLSFLILSPRWHDLSVRFGYSEKARRKGYCQMGAKTQQEDVKAENIVPSIEKVSLQDDSDEDVKVKKYLRGDGVNLESLKDKKLKGQLARKEDLFQKAAKTAVKHEKWLIPTEEGGLETEGFEQTRRIRQEDIVRAVDISSARKPFDLVLPELGPYTLDYTLNGRCMVFAGRKGHLAIFDTKTMQLYKEFQVGETVRDVVFLHNELYFAAAQKKYPYIYNRDGTELHCLKEHGAVEKLQFLKNLFVLVSVNTWGQLHYQDVTDGRMVGNYRTGLGRCNVMQVNKYNAIVGLGHSCGKVTMWAPSTPAAQVKMLCHSGPVTAMAFHPGGHLMATAGMDKKIKLWDLRKYEVLHTYPGHAKTLQFSQKGLLAVGSGSRVQIWRDSLKNQDYTHYMNHSIAKGYQVEEAMFQPYEDVLGLSHSKGISTILVPGSGEPNFDTWIANPYETPQQRREREVQELIVKIQPEAVMMDPEKIGTVRTSKKKEQTKEEREAEKEAAITAVKTAPVKKKTKGRNKPTVREKKKQDGIIRAKRPYLDQQLKEEEQRKKKSKISEEIQLPKALQRFNSKKPK